MRKWHWDYSKMWWFHYQPQSHKTLPTLCKWIHLRLQTAFVFMCHEEGKRERRLKNVVVTAWNSGTNVSKSSDNSEHTTLYSLDNHMYINVSVSSRRFCILAASVQTKRSPKDLYQKLILGHLSIYCWKTQKVMNRYIYVQLFIFTYNISYLKQIQPSLQCSFRSSAPINRQSFPKWTTQE